jgi:hypothetical protein
MRLESTAESQLLTARCSVTTAGELNRYVVARMICLKKIILYLVCLCIVSGCASTKNDAYDGPLPPRVLISSYQAQKWLGEFPLVGADMPKGPYWLPSFEIVASVDSALAKELSSPQNRYVPRKQVNSYAYGMQLLGITRNGQKVVYVNGFCDWERFSPRKEWVWVVDGGGCYFSFWLDAETKKVTQFRFNGSM